VSERFKGWGEERVAGWPTWEARCGPFELSVMAMKDGKWSVEMVLSDFEGWSVEPVATVEAAKQMAVSLLMGQLEKMTAFAATLAK